MAKIIGSTNKLYLFRTRKLSPPVRVTQMVAKKGWLSSAWNLYTIEERPMMPKAYLNRPVTTRVASGLSLSEVFARMEAHEKVKTAQKQNATQSEKPLISNENTIDDIKNDLSKFLNRKLPTVSVEKDIPSHNPRYWRNVQKKLGL